MRDPDKIVAFYTMLAEAAVEARAASRRYWAPGGPADRKYPQQPMLAWPDPGAAQPGDTELGDRRQRRRGR
jgi:hypothetical protein